MYIEEAAESVAAGTFINHPANIAKKKRITDKHLEMLDDIIATFDANLRIAKFNIIREYQAGNSYSYYIVFEPVTEYGQVLLPIDLIFRISNHSSKSADLSSQSNFVRVIGFTLDNEDYDKASDLIYRGIHIIRELRKGNSDILDEL
jgi:hypothetical protein